MCPLICNNIITVSTDKKHKWHWDKNRGWQSNVVSNTINVSISNTNVSASKPRGYMQDLLS